MNTLNYTLNQGMNANAATAGSLTNLANSSRTAAVRPAELDFKVATAAIVDENRNANFGTKRLPLASFNELGRELTMRFYEAQATLQNQGTVAITA